MIQHIWSVLCEKAVIDRDSNLVTIVNVMEQLNVVAANPIEVAAGAKELPVIPATAEVLSFWVKSDIEQKERGVARLLWQPPSHSEPLAVGSPFDIDLTEYPRLRTRVQLNGFPFQQSGRYWMSVQYKPENAADADWAEVSRLPLTIELTVQGET